VEELARDARPARAGTALAFADHRLLRDAPGDEALELAHPFLVFGRNLAQLLAELQPRGVDAIEHVLKRGLPPDACAREALVGSNGLEVLDGRRHPEELQPDGLDPLIGLRAAPRAAPLLPLVPLSRTRGRVCARDGGRV